jgi:hypothetical protein
MTAIHGVAEKCSCIFGMTAIHGGQKKTGTLWVPVKQALALKAASVRNW